MLERAIELQPDMAEAHNNMGLLFMSMHDFDSALDSFNKVISISPDYAPGYANIGNVHLQQGEYAQAITSYKKALDLGVTTINEKEFQELIDE